MDRIKNIADITTRLNGMLIILLSAVMAGSVFIQIVARNIFHFSFEAFEELPRFMLIWITYLGSAMLYRESGHLGVEFFVKMFKGTIRKIISVLTMFFNVLFFLLLIIIGYKLSIITMNQRSLQMSVRIGVIYLSLPISGTLMMLYFIEKLFKLQNITTRKN